MKMRNTIMAATFVAIVAVVIGLSVWALRNAQLASAPPGDGADGVTSEQAAPSAGAPQEDDPAAETDQEPVASVDNGADHGLRFVYRWNNRLAAWQDGADIPLAMSDDSHPPQVSPDGALLAFVRDGGLWVMDLEGGSERLLVAQSEIEAMGDGETTAHLHRFAWAPHARRLLFNTALDVEVGLALSNDLYLVDVESLDLAQLLAPGMGGEFTLEPLGRYVAVVAPDHVRLLALDGSEIGASLAYAPILTYSEFAFYPKAVWAADGSRVVVAIPPADSLANPHEPATLWSLAVDGSEPQVEGRFHAAAPGFWIDPTLQWVAYLHAPDAEEDENEIGGQYLALAHLDGSYEYTPLRDQGQFLGWSPDGKYFTISTPASLETLHLGRIEGDVLPIEGLRHAYGHQVAWLDEEQFLITAVGGAYTTVVLANVAGETTPLLELEPGSFTLAPVIAPPAAPATPK